VVDFEAPKISTYSWLNDGTFVGLRELDRRNGALVLRVFQVNARAPSANAVRIEKPADVPFQPWDSEEIAAERGAVVYTAKVRLGGLLFVGESKRGTRNVIPITGGAFSGRLQGSVVPAGADFQLITDRFAFDARYLLETHDGESILVRNAGQLGGLIPTFEARADGKYAWLNENRWTSDDPVLGSGVVTITVRERK
jgi:hypothetical protein